ncbi:MAG: dTMP kinase [Candidatus Omnitrophica bacterium]|nr:dTMP kinase [Candidatus Omnitrophota bacterium]
MGSGNGLKRGFFITLEGPEGSGKSTQIKNITELLKGMGQEPVVLREPGATEIGEAIRAILLHLKVKEMAPQTELLLYLAARAQIVHEKILPALKRGRVVICDRFEDSTLAYQGFGRGIPVEKILEASALARGELKPDLTFLLDLDPTLGFKRIKRGKDRMEKEPLAFHKKVRQGFLTLAKKEPKRFCVIDARHDAEQVFNQICGRLERVLQ